MTTIYKLIERVNVNLNDTQDSTNFGGKERLYTLDSIVKFIADNNLHNVNTNGGLGSAFFLSEGEGDLGYIQGWLVSPDEYNRKPQGFELLLGANYKPEVRYYAIEAVTLY